MFLYEIKFRATFYWIPLFYSQGDPLKTSPKRQLLVKSTEALLSQRGWCIKFLLLFYFLCAYSALILKFLLHLKRIFQIFLVSILKRMKNIEFMKNEAKNMDLERLNYLDTCFALSALWLYSLYSIVISKYFFNKTDFWS